MLVGKLNEPKLKNLAIVDLYVLVGCRETSIVDRSQFMATVVTPHELFMALMPSKFPWQCKIITDFRELLPIFNEEADQDGEEQADDDFPQPLTEEEKED